MKRVIVFLLALVFTQNLFAQGSSVGSSQLKIIGNSRSASLGEATVADAGRFSSAALNPANLATQGPVSLLLSHAEWIQDVQSEFIGLRLPYSFGTFGLTLSNTNVKGIEIREKPGPALGTFSARSAMFQLGFATEVMEDVTLGAGAKYLYEKLYVDEATGFAFDLGGNYRTPIENLMAGISITNIGSLEKFRTETSDLPSYVRVGATYLIPVSEFSISLSAAAANDLKAEGTHFQVGAEALYDNLVAVRAGYQSGFESRGLGAGIGIQYSLVQIDYTFVPFSLGLGNAHLFSVGFNF